MTIDAQFIFRYCVAFLFVLVYLFGGFIQYFIGIPSTLYMLLVLVFIYTIISFHALTYGKIYLNRSIKWTIILLAVIIISGVVNRIDVSRISLYTIFALLPCGVLSLLEIIKKRGVKVKDLIHSIARITVLIQLPIILLQRFFYSFFIQFNNSNQAIADYDFMFGTFFIRADHSLGFFLLVYLMMVFIKLQKGGYKKVPWFMITYISVTILVMESNLTKLFLFIVLSVFLFRWFFQKFRFEGLLLIALSGIIMFKLAMTIPVLKGHYQNIGKTLSFEQSIQAYEGAYAKRPQIVIAYITYMPLKIIGEGPYDYYNIFTGKFKQTKHFSQLIWSYNDLGIIGLAAVLILGIVISKNFGLAKKHQKILVGLMVFYLLMTNVYSDLGMLISLLLLDEKIV